MKRKTNLAPQVSMDEIAPAFDSVSARLRLRGSTLITTVAEALQRRGTWGENADALNRIYKPEGRPVSEPVLSAAFSASAERNYPRLEWLVLVDRDPEVCALLCPPKLTPEEELRITNEHLASEAPGVWRSLQKRLGRAT